MGVIGTGLYDDDTAADVRDTWRELVASGVEGRFRCAPCLIGVARNCRAKTRSENCVRARAKMASSSSFCARRARAIACRPKSSVWAGSRRSGGTEGRGGHDLEALPVTDHQVVRGALGNAECHYFSIQPTAFIIACR